MSVLLSLVLGAAGGLDLPAPAPPRPATGAFEPFDLTYLPRATNSVLAVRPNELVKHLGGQEKATTGLLRRTLGAAFAFIDGDLKAATPPALADIEQIIVVAQLKLDIETGKDGRGALSAGGISSGLVRTTAPFDWAGCLKKWFPKAERVKHAGREYVRVPFDIGKDTSYLGLFVADDRTLAFDSDEAEMKGLLARLDKKGKAPEPTGWGEVSRDLVALCHDTTAEGWLNAPAKPKREIDRSLATVARKSTGVALGFSAGTRTALRFVATARDAQDAKEVQKALKAVLAYLANDEETQPALAKLLAQATVSRGNAVVRLSGSAPGDLLRRLLDPEAEQ
ncbi:MAG TPA: hypothetical protein VGE74_26505 [Gemmata sp.]